MRPPALKLGTPLGAVPHKHCQIDRIMLHERLDSRLAIAEQSHVLKALIYECWTPPDHMWNIVYLRLAAALAAALLMPQPSPPPRLHPQPVGPRAQLRQPHSVGP